MKPRWSRNLNDAETAIMKKEWLASVSVRERLMVMLEEDIDKSLSEMRDVVKDGNVLHLTEYYAEEFARQRALQEVINLIK